MTTSVSPSSARMSISPRRSSTLAARTRKRCRRRYFAAARSERRPNQRRHQGQRAYRPAMLLLLGGGFLGGGLLRGPLARAALTPALGGCFLRGLGLRFGLGFDGLV